MVHRDLLEAVAAQAIHARVADVRDRHAIVVEQARDQRRAHAFALRLGLRGLIDDFVRAVDRVAKHDRLAHEAGAGLDVAAAFAFAGFGDEVDDGLHRDAAGDFARVVATHAVGEDPQADVRPGADRIFVVVSDLADISDLDVHQFPFEAHSRSCLVP